MHIRFNMKKTSVDKPLLEYKSKKLNTRSSRWSMASQN